jgi:HlyD family type I secretion membrane fusion protein
MLQHKITAHIKKFSAEIKKQCERTGINSGHMVAVLDKGAKFMTQGQISLENSAIAAVRMPLVVGFWVMLALALVILIWGVLVPIESAAVAKGSVMLLSNKKTVQHLEGGIIKDILVKEGDMVSAGDPLIMLNDTAATANLNVLQGQLYVARASELRLIALRDQLPEIEFDDDMVEKSKSDDNLVKVMTAQVQLFDSEKSGQEAKMAVLNQRIAQSEKEIEGLKSQIEGASKQIESYGEETDTVQTLLKKGYDTKPHLFDLQRRQSELIGNRGQYDASIAKIEQNIIETKMQVINQQKEFETKNSENLRDIQAQIADLQDKLMAARDVADRSLITAPVSGIVTGLKYHTAGGVIAPGTPIMDIVPQDDLLVVEMHVKPNDISSVHAGQDARVIFTSYKMRTTPKIPGKITQVSADIFTDEHGAQPNSYYLARVEVDKKFLQHMEKHIELYPGMPADVLIRTGSRPFISYLFKPITDSMHSAFREE